jgi:hypothetical protein
MGDVDSFLADRFLIDGTVHNSDFPEVVLWDYDWTSGKQLVRGERGRLLGGGSK